MMTAQTVWIIGAAVQSTQDDTDKDGARTFCKHGNIAGSCLRCKAGKDREEDGGN